MAILNRRQFATAVGVSGAFFVHTTCRGAAPSAKVDKPQVITRRPHIYHGWPTVAQRANGELLLVCSGGREAHVCPFGRVELFRSSDRGSSWSWPRTLIDGPIDDRDAGVLETAKGTLLATTFTSLAYEPILKRAIADSKQEKETFSAEKLERWQSVQRRLNADGRQSALGVWMARSDDGGFSWSKPYRCEVNSPHGPINLSDGRMLYAGKALWTKDNRVGVCDSKDDGRTWRWLATIPTRPGDDHKNYHELHAVEAAEGRLIVHIRNHNTKHSRETLQTESTDGGQTWTTPHTIGVWGLPSHLLRLNDDRLLMSYGHRRAPFGNQARISSNNGESWSDPILISGDGAAGDLGYPSTVQFEDASLLTVWYEKLKGSPNAVLRQAKWRLT
ncbi:MAG: sialidase family protein [Pirellulaceae bacterium]|nr:sialidase family protein [Pirellulaceae bacterium]